MALDSPYDYEPVWDKFEELDLKCGGMVVIGPSCIMVVQAQYRSNSVWRAVRAITQLQRPCVGLLHLWRCPTLGEATAAAQSHLEGEFAPIVIEGEPLSETISRARR